MLLIYAELNKIKSNYNTLYESIMSFHNSQHIDFDCRLMIEHLASDEYHNHVKSDWNSINTMLEKYVDLDEEMIYKTLKIRNRILKKRIKYFELNKLETCINIVHDVIHDIYIDIKRNRKSLRIS